MKILSADVFLNNRAEKGELYIRVNLNNIAVSSRLASDLNLQEGDFLAIAENESGTYIFKARHKEEGYTLRGSKSSKTLKFGFKPLATYLLKKYNLLDIIKGSDDFKHHKFQLEKVDNGKDMIESYRFIPPKQFGK